MQAKLLVFLAVWKRPEITEICFMGINRLRSGRFPIEAFAVISEDSMIPLCDKYGIEWVMYKNEPLGEKKNFGLKEAMKKDFDYMIEIGSDDLLKNEYLELFPWTDPVYGLREFIMMDTETGYCRKQTSRDAAYGLGRAIRKDVLTQVGDLWHDRQTCGLDNQSTVKLASHKFGEKRVLGEVAIDLKSGVNIWPYNHRMGEEHSFSKAISGLSLKEVTALKTLMYAEVEN